MVTSSEFDKVLVPVDYQKDVLVRTFDTLIGFNKKNKKGKFMKAIKEEYRWDPVLGKSVFVDREKENDEKTKGYKRVNLDQKISKPTVTAAEKKEKTAEEKKADKELYTGTLLNKVGKTKAQIDKELNDKIKTRRVARPIETPDDTDYTVEELADFFWKFKNIRENPKYGGSPIALKQYLAKNEKARKKADEIMISKVGHSDKKKPKKKDPAEKKTSVKLENSVDKITDWFWAHKSDPSFKTLFDNTDSRVTLARMIKNDPRGLKFFAKIMKDAGYVPSEEKPNTLRATLIKHSKPEAARNWANYDDAVEVLKAPIKRVQKAYREADQRIGIGINWAMEELFGSGWERI